MNAPITRDRNALYPFRWLFLLLAFTSMTVRGQSGNANDVIPDKPNPPRLVNDFVGILQAGARETLEEKLRRYNDTTSTQITIVIVKTTEPYPIGDFAFQVGRKWGVGQKGKNNGLVLAWATETRKIYIATGYGLEGAIPDAVANRIISNIIVPAFKQQQYYEGLDAATTEIIKRAQGEYKEDPSADAGGVSSIVFIIIIAMLVLVFLWIKRRGGGGGGSNRSRGGGMGGWLFPYTVFTGWGSSSGSWGSGGGGGGGGSDFGGFGGGSFGGGGAGGDY